MHKLFSSRFVMATEVKPVTKDLEDLKDFKLRRILDEHSDSKKIFLEGRLGSDEEHAAVVILEKMPFNPDRMQDLLQGSSLRTEFRNNIYGQYECTIEPSFNTLKANVIYPATDRHIAKYSSSPIYIINETPALYQVQ